MNLYTNQINLVSVVRVMTDDQGNDIEMNFDHGRSDRPTFNSISQA